MIIFLALSMLLYLIIFLFLIFLFFFFLFLFFFFFSSRRRHTRWNCDWSSDVCSSDLRRVPEPDRRRESLARLVRRRTRRARDSLRRSGSGTRLGPRAPCTAPRG